ncbi:MAG TPA: FecR domain-containing protein [Dyadobacter sp.]|jgi:ferric-dicitrate binding protein FerR (iron transport regulator)|nr:FecR domain-containing protein [Dyadobacter sp.]
MINYSHYTVADYLSDESFRQWVLSGGFRNSETPWSLWLSQNPEPAKEASKAREIILATVIREEPFPDDYFETIRNETLKTVRAGRSGYVRPVYWRAAAAIVLISAFASWYLLTKQPSGTIQTEHYTTNTTEAIPAVIYKENKTNTVVPVALPDGSSVLLHPESTLKYEKEAGGNRTVHLTGKAFFEVTKDPSSPFLVYSGEMLTKVLGTSFTVTAYSGDQDYSVVVKTGKVAVSKVSEQTGKNETVNLVPNEQVVFNRAKADFNRKDLEAGDLEKYVPATPNSYAFTDTPVATIFEQIGAAYGLKIDLNQTILEGCELTTNLTDEPLFEKLNIVCNSIGPGTSYIIENEHIRILSKGCNQ